MKAYRIKEPRCWVVRWDEWPDDPSTDYMQQPPHPLLSGMCDKKSAKEFATPQEARAFRETETGTPSFWRIVRRGRVSA